jgi:DNA-binding ferritin-like protein
MLLLTKGIKKNNTRATINNETFGKSAKIMSDTIAENKKDIKEMKEMLADNNKSYMNLLNLIEKTAKTTENNNNAIMGVLKLTYKEGVENEEQQEEAPKE